MSWYDALYGDDPSTDNIFGREMLRQRRTPHLHAFLQAGGRLNDLSPPGGAEARAELMARIDMALGKAT